MLDFLSHHNLPDERSLQPTTLLVLSSSTIARVFLIKERDISEFTPLSTDATEYQYSDDKGFSFAQSNTSIGTNIGFKETNDMHYDAIFVKFAAQKINDLEKASGAEKIIIYSPETLLSHYRSAFSPTLDKKISIKVGNYINISFPQLFDLVPNS